MNISIEISAATTKRLIALGVVAAGLTAGSLAWAALLPFKNAEKLTAEHLNGNFKEHADAIKALQDEVATLKSGASTTGTALADLQSATSELQKGPDWYLASGSKCSSPQASTWECFCDDGYVAVSGGAYGAAPGGNAIRGSNQIFPHVWRVSCTNVGGDGSCNLPFAVCVRAVAR